MDMRLLRSISGLHKAQVPHQRRAGRRVRQWVCVEGETLDSWSSNKGGLRSSQRLPSSLGIGPCSCVLHRFWDL